MRLSLLGFSCVFVLAACASVDDQPNHEPKTGSVSSALTYRQSRITLAPPALNVPALEQSWRARYTPPDPCHWETFRVGDSDGPGVKVPNVGRALYLANN